MRKTVIDSLCEQINTARGLTIGQVGYIYFANVRGDRHHAPRSVYVIINAGGGVAYSAANKGTYNKTAAHLRKVLAGETTL